MTTPFLTPETISLLQSVAEGFMPGVGDLWALTDYGDHFDVPYTGPVATDIACRIESVTTVNEIGLPERLEALGVDMKEYRRIHLPAFIVEKFPGVATNWLFTTNTGAAQERRYSVLNDPDIDGNYLVELVLECGLMAAPRGGA